MNLSYKWRLKTRRRSHKYKRQSLDKSLHMQFVYNTWEGLGTCQVYKSGSHQQGFKLYDKVLLE